MTRSSPVVPRRALALAFAAALAPLAAARAELGLAPGQGPASWRRVPLGLCEDYPEERRSIAEVRSDFDALAAAGVRSLRVSIGWDEIEPEDDRFDFAFWDAFVDLAEERGITLLPYVCYTPSWAARDPDAAWRSPPADLDALAQAIGALARRYRGRVPSWEIWNEPDNPAYWSGDAREYAALLQAGAAAVRAADPDAEVVLGGIAWDLEFLRQVLEVPGAAAAADVVNVHAYFETWSPEPLERLTEYLREAADLVAELGMGQPLWLAEVGYSSFRSGAHVSDAYRARYGYEHTPRYQADALVRTVALALASEAVERIAWYELRDLPPDEAVIGDVNNRHLGVLGVGGARRKPAFAALQLVGELLGGRLRCLDREVRAARSLGSEAEVHAFERADGAVVVVAWLRTHARGRGRISERGDAVDARRERLELWLPRALGDAELLDPRGRQLGVIGARGDQAGPGTSLAPFEVRGGETLVLVLPPEGSAQ